MLEALQDKENKIKREKELEEQDALKHLEYTKKVEIRERDHKSKRAELDAVKYKSFILPM